MAPQRLSNPKTVNLTMDESRIEQTESGSDEENEMFFSAYTTTDSIDQKIPQEEKPKENTQDENSQPDESKQEDSNTEQKQITQSVVDEKQESQPENQPQENQQPKDSKQNEEIQTEEKTDVEEKKEEEKKEEDQNITDQQQTTEQSSEKDEQTDHKTEQIEEPIQQQVQENEQPDKSNEEKTEILEINQDKIDDEEEMRQNEIPTTNEVQSKKDFVVIETAKIHDTSEDHNDWIDQSDEKTPFKKDFGETPVDIEFDVEDDGSVPSVPITRTKTVFGRLFEKLCSCDFL